MKKLLLLACIAIGSQAAYATKARVLALGESKDDSSYYFMDDRRVFLNPAFLNQLNDGVFLEWGADGAASTNLDTDASPKAEGGVFKNAGSLSYGLHFGNESDTVSLLHSVAGMPNASKSDNVLNVFVAGKSGVEWGANFIYSKNDNNSTGTGKFEQEAMAVRLGAIMGDAEAYAIVSLKNEAEAPNQTQSVAAPTRPAAPKFDGKLGYQVGGSYKVGHGNAYATWKSYGWDQTGDSAKSEGKYNEYMVGYGCVNDHGDGGRTFMRVSGEKVAIELKAPSAKVEVDSLLVPLVVGYEKDATSWLTLRGSVKYNVHSEVEAKNLGTLYTVANNLAIAKYGVTTETKNTRANSVDIASGLSLNFGKMRLDGVLGTDGNAGETGKLTFDDFYTRASAVYTF